MTGRSSSEEQTPHESRTPPSSAPSDDNLNMQSRNVSDCNCTEQAKQKEIHGLGHLPQHVPSSRPPTRLERNDETYITRIRVTDIAPDIRSALTNLYVVVHHSGREWKTENKSLTVNDGVEWSGSIPIPSDLSATICIDIHVYSESPGQSTSDAMVPPRKLIVTVEQLLEHSLGHVPFTPGLENERVASPCLSIFVTVECPESGDPPTLSALHFPTSSQGMVDITTPSRSANLCYREHGRNPFLDHVIEELETVLGIYLQDAPYCADPVAVKLSRGLYLHALATRPRGHVDQPFKTSRLAVDEVGGASTKDVLHQAAELSYIDRDENRAGHLMLQLDAGWRGPIQLNGQSIMEHDPTSRLTDRELWSLSSQLMDRFERTRDLVRLRETVTVLEKLVRSTPSMSDLHREGLANLGVMLWHRFDRLGELSDLEEALSNHRGAVALTPDADINKPGMLNNLGSCFKTRFERLGDPSDLEDSISSLRDSIKLIPPRHPEGFACLVNLGNSLLTRFKHHKELSDLEDAISMLRDGVDLTPNYHPSKSACLTNLGNAFLTRFKRLERSDDLEEAISMHKHAVALTHIGHSERPSRLNNLGNSLLTRFDCLRELSDLEDAISMLGSSADLVPRNDPSRPAYLSNLGNSILTRFEHLGELNDLERAISTFRHAVTLTPDDHSKRPSRLENLGNSLFTRFGRLGELRDLEEALVRYRSVLDPTHGLPGKAHHLYNLAKCSKARFEHLGELSDLEDAISMLRDALELTPPGHTDKCTYLNILGNSLGARFERLGKLNDLEDSISMLKEAYELTPCGHPSMPRRLSSLGKSFAARFEHLGELTNLEIAISKHRDAVLLTPHGHPQKSSRLNNLGSSFLTRFKCLGELSDLEDAISNYRGAVDLTPRGHPDRPGPLSNLGNCFIARFQRLGESSDLQNGISLLKDAVELTPDGHPDKPLRLDSLGNSFIVRYEHSGEPRDSDLEDALVMLRNAVQLIPHGHRQEPRFLNNLGTCLMMCFKRRGELRDLEDAISRHRDAVDLTPDGHPQQSGRINCLGTCFSVRFQRLGELSDIEIAVSVLRNAVDLAPSGHPDKPRYLNNLGTALSARFERLGELSDLEDTISTLRQAVDLTPRDNIMMPALLNTLGSSFRARYNLFGELRDIQDAILTLNKAVDLSSHNRKPSLLNNLAISLHARFERLGGISDLEDAISRHREAVNLIPHDHPNKSTCLGSLGNTCLTRFERFGGLGDLEDAISAHAEADGLTPHDHPDKPHRLNNLGCCFAARFESLGDPTDLQKAVSSQKDSVDLVPDGHCDKPTCLGNLGNYLFARFKLLEEPSDLEEAITVLSRAASSVVGATSVRFRASLKWISCARRMHHHSLLQAHTLAINLLPQLAWIGLSLTHRYSELMRGADVVREAAAAALDAGLPETAVEWLEQGRSIVWGDLFQLRSPHGDLSFAHPNYAHRLRELSAALEHASLGREKALLSEPNEGAMHRTTESLHQEADNHRQLAIKRDKLLQEIRGLPGFERFLLHKEFSQLRASAHSGPVVILNAAESRCDALIVRADKDRVTHVPLPNFTFKQSTELQNMVKDFVRQARASRSDDREGWSVKSEGVSWPSLLSPLWKCVVQPVLNALEISTPGNLSRIFWCPTGPFAFLPIHAAGFYDGKYSQSGHKALDFVVSSYVPTLSILGQSHNPSASASGDLRLLLVRQPPSDGLSKLPGVVTELEHIKEVIKDSPFACTTLLESSLGSVEEVLELMKNANWVHFSCHGVQDGVNPADSGLCLADERRLRLRDVIALSRPNGGLAFLSACQTATGEERLSDEAVHIAAGMLFAGYSGVVGTMWSISDKLAPEVARDVYEGLFRSCAKPDYLEAARALHDAVTRLRESGDASFDEWLPFIHVGL